MTKVTNIDLEESNGGLLSLEGMYKEYFLDYASYVILERAVPSIEDGLKPVQRRILHSMKNMDDGRFHKVANIIGQTMQYHPHGDAAIGDALVKLGQKDLLIDTQGNWGDYRTGDSSAAPRYIEARLTKFALEVIFNPQTTEWQLSYDGRNKEPVTLPVKFPLVLSDGIEGIAVGLATKILPHNFIELIKASIKILQDKKVKIYPDFNTGGSLDAREYNSGKRGGKVKVRSKIEQRDKKTLAITELPYGITTNSLIDSILKANDKGKIQIKKVIDNTAAEVEILLELNAGVSPDLTLDALYAFTNCEISISPNAVVIMDNKPHFLGVEDLLKMSTDNTKELLKQELIIKKNELLEKWHNVSLEKIFIEERVYRDIEEAESFEEVLEIIAQGLKKYVSTPSEKPSKSDNRLRLNREITEDDIVRLTEIKIKKISKYNKFKTDEQLKAIIDELIQVQHDLDHLTEFAIAYFENLLEKYSAGKERKTILTEFDTIKATRVVAKNAKLYVERKEGFIGTSLKKDEFVSDCSDIDDIIAFTKSGIFKVVRIGDKVFIEKNIIHVDVWKKNDDRTTYNMVYLDAKTGRSMAKRFNVTAVTRDKDYDLTTAEKGNKVLYFAEHKNGETETVQVQLSPGCKAQKKVFEFNFADLEIKGRSSKGNILTKYPVKKINLLEIGNSSLGAQKIWIDEVSGRLNKEQRGKLLGKFDTGDKLIGIFKNGSYEVFEIDFNKKIDAQNLIDIAKLSEDTVVSCIYFEGEKSWTMVKRFKIETTSNDQEFKFIGDNSASKLYYASLTNTGVLNYSYRKNKTKIEDQIDIEKFIDVKGWKALGNKLGEFKILKIEENNDPEKTSISDKENPTQEAEKENDNKKTKLSPGDSIEFDF